MKEKTNRTKTQRQAVAEAMEQLGGIATLAQLYVAVPRIQGCSWKTKTPQASIRRIVQLSDDIFKIKPGLYGLNSRRREIEDRGIIPESAAVKNPDLLRISNHTYYQGLLLLLGRYRRFECWAPNQDRNKAFLAGTIDDARTMRSLPEYTYPKLVKRSATIDVVWFNSRGLPDSFFEVECSSDIQNSLLKFNDLQDFHVRMKIVSDASRRREFDLKVGYAAFEDIRERVKFLDFSTLVKIYEGAAAQSEIGVAL